MADRQTDYSRLCQVYLIGKMRLAILSLVALGLTACGGGSGGGNSSSSNTESAEARVIPTNTTVGGTGSVVIPTANSVLIADAAAPTIAAKVLMTSNFEGITGSVGPGWRINYWSGAVASTSLETASGFVISGATTQKFVVTTKGNGDAHLYYAYPFQKGKRYHATVKIRAQSSATVSVFIRKDTPYLEVSAINTQTIGSTVSTISAEGVYNSSDVGSLRISTNTLNVPLYIDDVTIEEVTINAVAPTTHTAAPATLFGVVINRFGAHRGWPALGLNVVRLWDTGTTWSLLEPCDNCWDFSTGSGKRMDLLVDYIKYNDPNAQILYTMGQTPAWAATNPGSDGAYGLGSNSAPKDLTTWRRYVKTLATRYKGRIRYWELWNEADYSRLYEGSVETMVEMARIAREELKAADPANVLISPSYTGGGLMWLNNFFGAGGKNYVDAVAIHGYYALDAEGLLNSLSNLRQIMKTHGISNKPIWNTEGGLSCTLNMASCLAQAPGKTTVSSYELPIAAQRGAMARAFAFMWTNGIVNFNHYTLEGTADTPALADPATNYTTQTPYGIAYLMSSKWIVGSSLVDAYQTPEGIYVFKMKTADNKPAYLVWSTKGTQKVRTPATWPITKLNRLDSTSAALSPSTPFDLTDEPVLLQ